MHQLCDQIIRQRYVHDCLYKEIAIPPHLLALDLEKFAIPKKHVMVCFGYTTIMRCRYTVPFASVYFVEMYHSGVLSFYS
jgi:deoxycytidine triphosphate deaminase